MIFNGLFYIFLLMFVCFLDFDLSFVSKNCLTFCLDVGGFVHFLLYIIVLKCWCLQWKPQKSGYEKTPIPQILAIFSSNGKMGACPVGSQKWQQRHVQFGPVRLNYLTKFLEVVLVLFSNDHLTTDLDKQLEVSIADLLKAKTVLRFVVILCLYKLH